MTEAQKSLAKKYYAYEVLTSFWVVGAIWLYFYRLFIDDQQVGLLDGMAFAVGLLAEIPSGALADKFGRSTVVRLGQTLAGVGILIQAFGSSFTPFFVGQAILMVGLSLASGADEALFFENLKFKKDSLDWRKLVTRVSQAGLIGGIVAMLLGGWLHTINSRIPWVLTGLAFIGAALVIWTVKDAQPKGRRQKVGAEVKEYFANIKVGFAQFRLPQLRLYVPIIIVVQGLFYTVGFGILRLILLARFHFDPLWSSLTVASCSLITIAVLAVMHKHAGKISEKNALVAISLSAAAGLLLALADIGLWGYTVILILYVGEHILSPFMSDILNKHAPDSQRATVLSVASFLKSLPYVLLAPLIGYLNAHGQLNYYLAGWALFICPVVLVYLARKKRDDQIELGAPDLAA
jgi:MFS family permease